MIFLAIDEMQNAECRMQNEAEATPGFRLRQHSAFCILHSAFPKEQDECGADEQRLMQIHLQGREE